jgi:methionyl-tRNA synthetase
MTGPVWLTATPPTPNGELHVGHMAGPYVAVDVLRRYLRAESASVVMTTGLDDHQSYVAVRGLLEGRTPEQVADDYGERITRAWTAAGVEFDRIVAPRSTPGYAEFVQEFFHKLYGQGAIVPRTKPLPYCDSCRRWLYEALVAGRCPHCGAGSNGNACEACGRPNDCGDLLDPTCVRCGTTATPRAQTRLFLPLEPFADRLSRFWETVSMPPHLRALCERMRADGLPEIAVSHPSDWGVRVPVPEFAEQRIYVWFEMAPGYLLEYGSGADPARPAGGPVQFFGFDNGYFHAVLFPALYLAWDQESPLPSAFVVNEFYQLAGQKFSTSRRHVVNALDALAEAGSDVLRLQVLRNRPNGRQTSFDRADLVRVRDHLHTIWNGWVRSVIRSVREETGGVVPDDAPHGSGEWGLFAGRLGRLVEELREAYSIAGFDPRRAVDLLDELVRCGRDFGHVHHHERDRPGGATAYRAALAAQLAALSALSAWAAPALPAGSARLSALLGVSADRRVDAAALAVPRPGTRLHEPDRPVFGG